MDIPGTMKSWRRHNLRAVLSGWRAIFLSFRRRAADCQGFGLMEVLVATAVMGLVLVVLLQVLTGAMRAQEAALGHARALQVAEMALQQSCNAMNLAQREYQGEDGPYRYLVRVTPQYEESNITLNRRVKCSLIQVTVSWREREGEGERHVELETIRTVSKRG
jgi:prepilin-type N-terminal cleavage/methylation domain-containing protein